ncbi:MULTISPECIES: hypothetical protein [Streptomyces]
MPTQEEQAKTEARLALYKAITATAAEVPQGTTTPAGAEALRNLAEAFAFATSPNQPH